MDNCKTDKCLPGKHRGTPTGAQLGHFWGGGVMSWVWVDHRVKRSERGGGDGEGQSPPALEIC